MILKLNDDVLTIYGKDVHICFESAHNFKVVEKDEIQEVVFSANNLDDCVRHIATTMACKDLDCGWSVGAFNDLISEYIDDVLRY